MASDYDATEFVDTDFQAHRIALSAASAAAGTLARADPRGGGLASRRSAAEARRTETRAGGVGARTLHARGNAPPPDGIPDRPPGNGPQSHARPRPARRSRVQTPAATPSRWPRPSRDFRDALAKVQAVHDETWTKDNFNVELTRALTADRKRPHGMERRAVEISRAVRPGFRWQ